MTFGALSADVIVEQRLDLRETRSASGSKKVRNENHVGLIACEWSLTKPSATIGKLVSDNDCIADHETMT